MITLSGRGWGVARGLRGLLSLQGLPGLLWLQRLRGPAPPASALRP